MRYQSRMEMVKMGESKYLVDRIAVWNECSGNKL
jgi:hypothetical protein